ncbi:AAA family ATPase [Bradyrhizobium erythrophlei]|uniref:PAS domain S-box-containing protein n=1 Tax=Bradyrhizobium erythrophlei TaxID=1437360 RepID=A0A1H5A001_9BRAD|nr:AAA family ATPase [Bradyrhizobium erythrophlei]SED35587.1 PAS domain S-box-containing protein [Bradyrhizobium erythrophlei]
MFKKAEDGGVIWVLSREGDTLLRRVQRQVADGELIKPTSVLTASENVASNSFNGLTRGYELAEYLDDDWALRPIEISHENGQATVIFEDPGGELLSQLLDAPMETEMFLRLAIGITAAVGNMHQRGLVHKDIKPANILVNSRDEKVRLTGFGVASRIPRERQSPEPPEFIAGTIAYMAPEQTGRMNRSIDSRSDLYALGITFYQMLTGRQPFNAADAMEWIHCHIARRPPSPVEHIPDISPAISAIVMKLLEKAAEDRYQTAAGLEHDLRCCLSQWEKLHQVSPFPLGERDVPDRLLIPEKLYGRERDIETLLAAFDSVLANGAPELVLVSGYSGIGKSAAVNELHKVLVLPRGLFASGKFDQYKRDIPYATLAQAFQSLVRQLLVRPETKLSEWRDRLLEALEPNGQLIVDLVPELKLIIGDQPAVPELPPVQAKVRFQQAFRSFIGVFARPEHPLALFLDDLQWLDAATLDLVESLLIQPDLRYLLLIGAYRDNEVDSTHPLVRKLDLIRQDGGRTRQIVLAPLAREDLTQLIMDSLHCGSRRAEPLAQMVHEKTAGNPFFAIQFVSTLVDEALLTFDHLNAQWQWDLSRIDAQEYTANVVDLMVGKLNRLPVETQETLQLLACLGNTSDVQLLSMVQGTPVHKLHADLWEARRAELVVRSDNSYTFVHDRVQEAAYSRIPADRRAETHLRLARLLNLHAAPDKREEAIFEIVAQFDRAVTLIASRDEREQLAELNLAAGRRAKASAAYASALKYFVSGTTLLTDDCWRRRHDLAFQLQLQRAECEFLTGDLKGADERLAMLSSQAATEVERSAVTCLRVDLYTALDRPDQAVAVCLAYLRLFGIKWSSHPTEQDARQEYDQVWSNLRGRAIEDLIDLPLMTDLASLAILDVLTKVAAPAIFTDANLFSLVICRIVNLSLQRGNSDGSCFAYVSFALTPNARLDSDRNASRFGNLGYELVERRGLRRFQARTYLAFGKLVPWTQHVRASRDIANRTIDAALKAGDITYATYSLNLRNAYRLAAGDPLAEVQRDAEGGIEFQRRAKVGLSIVAVATQLSLVRTLRGLSPQFGSMDGAEFDEVSFERQLASDPSMASSECWYWVRKLQGRFLAGDYLVAVEAASKAKALLWSSAAFFEEAEYHFYAALSHAACWAAAATRQRRQHENALAAHYGQLETWADNCPANFESRVALVGAEIARIGGRDLEAMRLYERAIQTAHANGFVNNEGIANELTARFYMGRGFETIARAYLREARACYQRWGADGKVRQLDSLHPWLREHDPIRAADTTIATRSEHLDFATVVKVSQTLSGEMVLENLVDALMRLAIEHAGAERGVLLLSHGGDLRQEAEAITTNNGIIVRRAVDPEAHHPDTIVQYAMRAREIVIVDDASADPIYSTDAYVLGRKVKSVLCLPLINESKITGVLYLENNLARRVFTPNRIAVVKLLALQAAISLENTQLYGHLAQAERALSISERNLQLTINTIPALVWSTRTDGTVEFVNQHYCDYAGLDVQQFLERGWNVAVHPDDLKRLKGVWEGLIASGKGGEAEARFRRADGEYRWFLARVSPLHDEDGNIVRWYGVNTDIEDRKRAEIHLTGEKQILEMVASSRPLREVLEALCKFFEGFAPGCYCGIYPIDTNGKTFQYGVAPLFPAVILIQSRKRWSISTTRPAAARSKKRSRSLRRILDRTSDG